MEGYGRFLERSGRTQEAKEFYSKLASDTALQPIVEAAQARMESGKKPERIVASPQDGAAEAMFGIAASLTDDSSADVSVLYLRFARYLRSDFDLADILLADRLEAMEKFDEAIDVYHGIAKTSPYRRVAMVQAAVDEARLERNDKAIADLREVVTSHPDDAEAWTALGDVYRGVEKFADAADAYDNAIKILRQRHRQFLAAALCARGVLRTVQPLAASRGRSEGCSQIEPAGAAAAELSGLFLGRQGREPSRSARHAGKSARLAPVRWLHRR